MQNNTNPVQTVEYSLLQRLPKSRCTRLDFSALNDLTHNDLINANVSIKRLNVIINSLTRSDVQSTVSYVPMNCLVHKYVDMTDTQYFLIDVLQSNFQDQV